MGLYAEQIRERQIRDQKLEDAADRLLMDGLSSDAVVDELDSAMAALDLILTEFGLAGRRVLGCSNLEELIESTLDQAGIMSEKTDLTDGSYRGSGSWILAWAEDGRCLVLKPALAGYRCIDVASGKSFPLRKSFRLKTEGYVIHRPLIPDRNSARGISRLILKLILPQDIAMIGLCTVIFSALGLAIPEINAWVLRELLPRGSAAYGALIYGMVLFATVGILRTAITTLKTRLLSGMRLRITTQVQSALMAKVLLMPYANFSTASSGKVATKISSGQKLAYSIINVLVDTSFTLLFSFIYIPQMLRFGAALCIPALLILAAKILISGLSLAASARNHEAVLENEMELNSMVYTILRGIQKVKSVNAESRLYARWAQHYNKRVLLKLDPPAIMKLSSVLISFFSGLCTVLLLSLAAATGVSREDYIAFNASYALVVSAFNQLIHVMESISMMGPLVRQVNSLVVSQDTDAASRQYVHSLRGRITLENVCFSYPDGAKSSLENICLDIRPRQKIAIVGESGSGKSTLLKLLLGMEQPDKGNISYDGSSMHSLDGRSLRKRIGSVMQFSKIMPGTLFDNISFGSVRPVTLEEAWEAAEKAAIADDIRRMPLGMDTEVSESSGGGFSGGQRQRLMIARALVSRPSVLLLDEATSALDNLTQKKVLDSIYKEKATVIMVAHRLSTVIHCDSIVMLENGRIVEQGTYTELMERNGKFADLVRKQQE